MPSPNNPGVMSKRAQSVLFTILVFIFLGSLITLRVLDIKLELHETLFFILGTYACMDVLSGRGFFSQILRFILAFRGTPPGEQ